MRKVDGNSLYVLFSLPVNLKLPPKQSANKKEKIQLSPSLARPKMYLVVRVRAALTKYHGLGGPHSEHWLLTVLEARSPRSGAGWPGAGVRPLLDVTSPG